MDTGRSPYPALAGTLVLLGGLALGLGGLGLTGCASAPAPVSDADTAGLLRDAAFGPPTEPVRPEEVFALSPAMRDYVQQVAGRPARRLGLQRGLMQALNDEHRLRLQYDAGQTRNAAQAFAERAGNCLSLAIMTAALADALGLPVSFQAFEPEADSFSRSHGMVVANGHVNLVLGTRLMDRTRGFGTDFRLVVDFLPPEDAAGRSGEAVSRARVMAMFFNNRAAEALAAGDLDQAYAWARAALTRDPAFASAPITLAVIYVRRGLPEAAEQALRQALRLQPDNTQALANLVLLLRAAGREDEAARHQAHLRQVERVPPFHFLEQAREALGRGDRATAIALLQRELARDPSYHEVHYWLAVAYAGDGQAQAARRHLAQARQNSPTRAEQALYSAKLDRLDSLKSRAVQ